MKKLEDLELPPESTTGPVGEAAHSNEDHTGLPVNESSKFLFDIFERSVEKLDPVERQSVLEHQAKLMKSFTLLSEKIGEILSSEEGRRIMQQELLSRERSKK